MSLADSSGAVRHALRERVAALEQERDDFARKYDRLLTITAKLIAYRDHPEIKSLLAYDADLSGVWNAADALTKGRT